MLKRRRGIFNTRGWLLQVMDTDIGGPCVAYDHAEFFEGACVAKEFFTSMVGFQAERESIIANTGL
jgi:hypothetical protein